MQSQFSEEEEKPSSCPGVVSFPDLIYFFGFDVFQDKFSSFYFPTLSQIFWVDVICATGNEDDDDDEYKEAKVKLIGFWIMVAAAAALVVVERCKKKTGGEVEEKGSAIAASCVSYSKPD